MRILAQLFENGSPPDREPSREMWDLETDLMFLVYFFGNGHVQELRVVAETEDGLAAFKGLAIGTGNAKLAQVSKEDAKASRLYLPDYECYRQPMPTPNFIFIHPQPPPDLFPEVLPAPPAQNPTSSDGNFSHMDYK
ncbi:MAG: hypothetical protein RLZZ519_1472 [Bacteroidota bacterium]|jgi:hypothetical protein